MNWKSLLLLIVAGGSVIGCGSASGEVQEKDVSEWAKAKGESTPNDPNADR